ncbi:unnamed protein product [Heterosigma akashiwo]
MILFGSALHTLTFAQLDLITHYQPGSRLQGAVIQIRGFLRQPHSILATFRCWAPYTKWSVLLLATSFFLNGKIALAAHYGGKDSLQDCPWVLRLAVLLFEVAAPNTILVSAVVRYVLWPSRLASGLDTKVFTNPRSIIDHNFIVIVALSEVGLLGGLPVRNEDFSVAPIFGISYVLFTWAMMNHWGTEPEKGPQFIYPFFDTTLGAKTSMALLCLLAVLIVAHVLFAFADSLLVHFDDTSVCGRMLLVVFLASLLCRFRD